ncbi:MAG: PAS domain-containing sensor histidine kinase, partial [Xanthomonas perforans]|nr:PAS domain-containing sensor histidine kinase [Xanthomonas perforans]
MPSSPSLIDRIQSAPQRELYFFSLYRVLVAGLIAALVFSPLSDAIPEPRYPRLAAGVAIGYLSVAIPLLFWGRSER